MQHFPLHRQLGLRALVVCLLFGAVPGIAQPGGAQQHECRNVELTPVRGILLSDTSCEMAREVCYTKMLSNGGKALDKTSCVYDLIVKLGKLNDRCGTQAPEALMLCQEISELVLTASLQVDGFLAEIDSETAEIRAVHEADGATR
jgi:hypothetical protein